LDDQRRTEMTEKLVMHYRGPKETIVRYNKYVVNDKLFWTVTHDAGKKTQNSGMCVPNVDGLTYYEKLTDIIKVEYYNRTKYVMFKCDWADITRDRAYKVDEYDMVLVNFNHLVHRRDRETDDPYVLTLQVDQVFYVEDERNPGLACAVRTKPTNVYDNGQGDGSHDESDNYHECKRFLLNQINDNDPSDDFDHARPDSDPILA
jgi:hypothetical protein